MGEKWKQLHAAYGVKKTKLINKLRTSPVLYFSVLGEFLVQKKKFKTIEVVLIVDFKCEMPLP